MGPRARNSKRYRDENGVLQEQEGDELIRLPFIIRRFILVTIIRILKALRMI